MAGELDKNVDPASTMQVVNALIKADKDFELVVFPGAGHGQVGAGRQRNVHRVSVLVVAAGEGGQPPPLPLSAGKRTANARGVPQGRL